ncbi:aminotransferase class III-fold pyridoxal phosphate-dependent enzyme, partial [Burkholderia contaminans]
GCGQGVGGAEAARTREVAVVGGVGGGQGVLAFGEEVVAGRGSGGSLVGGGGWSVRPDIMCLAKGISSGYVPLGATVVNARIEDAFAANADFGGAIMHGYTYAGHPVACAAAIASLDIVVKEDLPANAAKQGAYLLEALKPFAERFAAVGEVRGKGPMPARASVANKDTPQHARRPSGNANRGRGGRRHKARGD